MEPKTRVAKVINKPNDAPVVRHGTVESVDGDTIQVLIDNTASPITCARACVCVQGDRVVVVGKDAIATVGANYGGGGSGSIATTGNILKGDNQGNAIAATPGTDYMAPVTLAPVATSGDYNDLDNLPTIPAAGLPTGGSSGQILAKVSGTDYDVGWVNQSGGGGASLQVVSGTADNQSVSASSYVGMNIAISVPSGYTPIGVVGIHLANASSGGGGVTLASIAQFFIQDSTHAYVRIKNTSSTALKLAVTADVLCVSN